MFMGLNMWDLSEGCKTQKNGFNDNNKNVITYV